MKLTLLLEEYLDGPEVGGSECQCYDYIHRGGMRELGNISLEGSSSAHLPMPATSAWDLPVHDESPWQGSCCRLCTQVDVDLVLSEGAPVYGAITDNWPTIEPYFNETGKRCSIERWRALCIDPAMARMLHDACLPGWPGGPSTAVPSC